jgi:hypothetical protein
MAILINNKRTNNKYNGTVVPTKVELDQLNNKYNTKLELFYYSVQQNWSKKIIMAEVLGTTRDQYFYNYYIKYLSTKSTT